MQTKPHSPKLLQIIVNANLGLFILAILTQVFFSASLVMSYLLQIVCGIYIASYGALFTYYSWTLDAKNFKLWVDQSLSTGALNLWKYKLSDFFGHRFTRIFSPILTLVGFIVIGFMLLNIINYFLR